MRPRPALSSFVAVALFACDRSSHVEPAPAPGPEAATQTQESVVVSPPADPGAPTAEPRPALPDPRSPIASAPAPPASAAPRPTIGGSWGTCHEQFRPTSSPERDVLRLALLCGPANGMKQLGPILRGEATDAGVEHAFDAKAGECFRLFAVADAAVSDLAVELHDPAGRPLADGLGNRWLVVGPDRPVCARESGRHGVRVVARSGAGPYALTIWRLPAAK